MHERAFYLSLDSFIEPQYKFIDSAGIKNTTRAVVFFGGGLAFREFREFREGFAKFINFTKFSKKTDSKFYCAQATDYSQQPSPAWCSKTVWGIAPCEISWIGQL